MRAIASSLSVFLFAIFVFVTGCQFHNGTEPVVVQGEYPIFYVKRPKGAIRNPIDAVTFNPGGDLFMRDISSPVAKDVDITGHITLGAGDVSDPSPSFDGKKIVFAMRCSESSSSICAQDNTWDIWIYDFERAKSNNSGPALYPVITNPEIRRLGDDTDPIFIPGNKIVFTSTRQTSSQDKLGYSYVGEDLRGPASVLHVMDLNGNNIQQLSFHQAHERNPSVMQNGRILFSRWENLGNNDKFSLFSMNPDGTDIRGVYGMHSPGDAFMSGNELSDGRVVTTVMPLSGTSEGGALMLVDAKNYADAEDPAPGYVEVNSAYIGQKPATVFDIPIENKVSLYGRYSTPSPVQDGSGNVLVSYSRLMGLKKVGGTTSTDTPFDKVEENPPEYGVFMFNLVDRSLKPVILPEDGFSITDPVAAIPVKEPPIIPPSISSDPARQSLTSKQGILNIKSVYDTDQHGRMGVGTLTPEERVSTPIPQITPSDSTKDRREKVADIATIKNPTLTTASQRPARFIRIIEGLPRPSGLSLDAIGLTPFQMRRIAGYAPVEPDGSVKVKVPAAVPITVQVLDANGRAFENPTNWIQVQPGESLTCNGCHSPRLTEPLNRSPIAGTNPGTLLRLAAGGDAQGVTLANETMAEARTRLDPQALEISADLVFNDVWTDSSVRPLDPSIRYSYTNLTTATPVNGVVNYPDNIQPLWDASRPSGAGDRKCIGCHNGIVNTTTNPSGLDLRGTVVAGSGRFLSYDSLLEGNALFDSKGFPVFETATEGLIIQKGIPLVRAGYARRSYLVEKLFNQELHAERGLPSEGLDHSTMLSPSEKRLVVEWIDIGAQYYNSPVDEAGKLRKAGAELDRQLFTNSYNTLHERCGGCHRAVLFKGEPNKKFQPSRFILTGNFDSDFEITAKMVTDINDADNSLIISKPINTSEAIHPQNTFVKPSKPYMVANSTDTLYTSLKKWIEDAKNRQQDSTVLVRSVPYSQVKP